MAFRYQLAPSNNDSHQADPYWFAVIVRFAEARTYDRERAPTSQDDYLSTQSADKDPVRERTPALLISNQIVSWQISSSKSSHLGSASFKLLPGAIDPTREFTSGDWILFWAFDNKTDFDRVSGRAQDIIAGKGGGANAFLDGLKFVGRVNAPRRERAVDPSTGRLTLHYMVTAVSFSEFDGEVYYHVADQQFLNSVKNGFGKQIERISGILGKGIPLTTPEHQRLWLNIFLGAGPANKGLLPGARPQAGNSVTPNEAYRVPATVGRLLGIETKNLQYKDLLQDSTFIGVQGPSPSGTLLRDDLASSAANEVWEGFVPTLHSAKMQGTFIPQIINFSSTSTWAILEQFSCAPINEMYTALKVGSKGNVVPSYTCRQIPFSSKKLKGKIDKSFPMTSFVDLPRWVLDTALVMNEEVGPSDSLRCNYVHIQGVDVFNNTTTSRAQVHDVIVSKPIIDQASITAHGLHTYVRQTNADLAGLNGDRAVGRNFNRLMADILMDLHLKWSGTIQSVFLQEPVAIGDNLEFENQIYHIENITHSGRIEGSGRKTASTSFSLSHGISTLTDISEDDEYADAIAIEDTSDVSRRKDSLE